MELSQLRYFVALCGEKNFTRAAKRCGVSQPSLSNGIKALEAELGGELFMRSTMSLTALGKSVRPHFESAIDSVEHIGKGARAFHLRLLARRRADARRILRSTGSEELPTATSQGFEYPAQSEGANDRHSRKKQADQQIIG